MKSIATYRVLGSARSSSVPRLPNFSFSCLLPQRQLSGANYRRLAAFSHSSLHTDSNVSTVAAMTSCSATVNCTTNSSVPAVGGQDPTVVSRWPFFPAAPEIGPVAVGSATAAALQEDAENADERCQDVGNVVLLEHLNLEVPDLEAARLFFSEGLGLTCDPATSGAQRGGPHVIWYNCGKQQFHIARGPLAQCLPPGAVVGLVMPDVAAVAERLEAVRQLLGDVSITYARGDTLEVTDPYGNTYAVHASLPYFPGRQGIAYLQLPCFRGTAHRIAGFYATRMGARCRVSPSNPHASHDTTVPNVPAATATAAAAAFGGPAGGGVPARAEVWMGPGQKLVFVEQAHLGPVSEQAVASLFGGWHIAMYVADFSRTYHAVHHPSRVPFNEHPYRDKYHNLQDALRNRQFRFQDIVYDSNSDPHSDVDVQGTPCAVQLLYRISHEVRSMHHPLYGRPLYGRETGFM